MIGELIKLILHQKLKIKWRKWNIFDFISPIDRVEPISNYRLPGHPLWGGCERDRSVEDWSHGNSASMDPDGNIIVSLGHLNQIISMLK